MIRKFLNSTHFDNDMLYGFCSPFSAETEHSGCTTSINLQENGSAYGTINLINAIDENRHCAGLS